MDTIGNWSTIFAVIKLFVCFLGIFFNGVVILAVWKDLHRFSAHSYLILSIAISDFVSCSVAVPFSISVHFQKQWPFGMAGCKAHAFMIFLLALISITHLAALSVEKLLTITRSLFKESYFNKTKTLWIIIGLWAYSLIFSVPPLFGWSRYGIDGTNETCSIVWHSTDPSDVTYFAAIFIACFTLPITLITFCYYKIHKISGRIVDKTLQMNRMVLLKKHHKSAMYFLIIIATFLLSWSPYAVVSFLRILGESVNPIKTSTCSVFAKMSFFLNPLLYAIVSRKLRRRIIRAIKVTRPNRVEVLNVLNFKSDSLVL